VFIPLVSGFFLSSPLLKTEPFENDHEIHFDTALCNYAAALQKIGRLKESEALYSRALNVNHRCYYAWCNLGVLASMHQDYRVSILPSVHYVSAEAMCIPRIAQH
jgi:tetratricopeptide (TPR) repeat protein